MEQIMLGSIVKFFSIKGFMPHGMCLLWTPSILWTLVVSNALITLSYILIPLALVYVYVKRNEFDYVWIFLLFGAFIILCGITHFVNIVTYWKPIYGVQAIADLMTAIVSITTAAVLWLIVPKLLKVPTAQELEIQHKELKHAHETIINQEIKFNSVVESLGFGICIVDKNNNITYRNEAFIMFFEVANELYIKQKILEILDEETLDSLFKQKKQKVKFEYKENIFEVSLLKIPTEDNQYQSGYVFQDITNETINKEKLLASNKALEEKNNELNDFTYIASHDLKEPLRGISYYSGLLLEDYRDKLDERGIYELETMSKLSLRMNKLIDGLREYARIGNDGLALRRASLKHVIEEKLDMLSPLIKERGVEIQIISNLPKIVCNESLVGHIIYNIVLNGIKYNKSKTPIIKFLYYSHTNEHEICITDNGIGIEKEDILRVFTMFKRLHGKEEFGEGLGIGMSIVKKIVQKHHGRIWINSEPGKGTEMHFTLRKEDDSNIEKL
jgi:signal transduction histidine kinase/ABC-type transport system involved in multi-copper enzyme maturation permease subunit